MRAWVWMSYAALLHVNLHACVCVCVTVRAGYRYIKPSAAVNLSPCAPAAGAVARDDLFSASPPAALNQFPLIHPT